MSIVERDRAAAWFSEEDSGAQVLLCSEIGSEGRNFQFASNLVMFDLPFNPAQQNLCAAVFFTEPGRGAVTLDNGHALVEHGGSNTFALAQNLLRVLNG